MLDDVKDALRANGNDGEVIDLIESAKFDLAIAGVNKVGEDDPLIKRAIILYCKAHFGYDDVNMSERFERSYISLKQHLTLSQEYTGDANA